MFGAELPRDRSERWRLLGRVVERWFPESREPQGVPESELQAAEQRLGLSLPEAFREWYERYGARHDVWSLQDRLLPPRELRVERDVLIFSIENQGVCSWGIRLQDLATEDPPIVVSDPDGGKRWLIESPTTSGFAIQLAVGNVKWSSTALYSANGQASGDAIQAVDRAYPRLPFPIMNWPAWPTRLYGRDDIVIETHGDSWIWATARSASALAELDAIVRAAGMLTWELYEDGTST